MRFRAIEKDTNLEAWEIDKSSTSCLFMILA